MKKLKKVCQDEGAFLIFDEMITGFRWGLPGAKNRFGVEPDLSIFGKGIANGFSVAALVAKPEIMELGGIRSLGQRPVFFSSTSHGSEMGRLAAFLETLRIYKTIMVLKNILKLMTCQSVQLLKLLRKTVFAALKYVPCSYRRWLDTAF